MPARTVRATKAARTTRAARTARTVRAALALPGLGIATLAFAPSGSWAAQWSSPASLAVCSTSQRPLIAFPETSPSTASGPGALVWVGAAGPCAATPVRAGAPGPGRAGRPAGVGRGVGIGIATIGADDRPVRPAPLPIRAGYRPQFSGPITATATSEGQIVIAAGLLPSAAPGASTGAIQAALTEGPAGGPFSPPAPLSGPPGPLSATAAYLGDVAVASLTAARPASPAGTRIALRVQRHSSSQPGAPQLLDLGPGRVTALTVTMDYRSDALVVWQQAGAIFAHELKASHAPEPTQRLGASRPDPQIQALVSDDNRGIVAWSTPSGSGSGSPPATRVYVDISGPHVHFGRPHLLETLADRHRPRAPVGWLRLVRLSTERVMLAWTGRSGSHRVVRAAPVRLSGVRPPTTLSDPATDSVLADLAPGPRGEAIALWRSARREAGRPTSGRQGIIAARGTTGRRARFSPPETVADAGQNDRPSVAVDPATDRAVVVWRRNARGGPIAYAVRVPGPPIGTAATPRPRRTGASFPGGPAFGAALGALILAIAGLGLGIARGRARHRRRRTRT